MGAAGDDHVELAVLGDAAGIVEEHPSGPAAAVVEVAAEEVHEIGKGQSAKACIGVALAAIRNAAEVTEDASCGS